MLALLRRSLNLRPQERFGLLAPYGDRLCCGFGKREPQCSGLLVLQLSILGMKLMCIWTLM
jgi:hypothetical protein